jgi:putative ABC transport system permease protein
MFYNYLTIAYRNLIRYRVFSAITISGLVISMAAFLLILQYVYFEKSYDSFHEQGNDLYRIDRITEKNGEKLGQGNQTVIAQGPAMKEDISEVAEFTRLHPAYGETIIIYENQSYKEKNLFYVDASFLQLFSFPLLKGDKHTVLSEPNSLIISQSAARKYFGEEEPTGKTLTLHDIGGKHLYIVKGIFEDMPANTAIMEDEDDNRDTDFDFLLSNHQITQLGFYKHDPWQWTNFITFVRLHPTADPALVQSKLTSLNKKYVSKGMAGAGIEEQNFLKPLTLIHTHAHINLATGVSTLSETGKTLVYLSVIALFILGIGYINYINLSTARALERAKEVGIRKVVGASRMQLVKQFLLYAILISSLAFILAITVVQLLLPVYKTFAGKTIPAMWQYSLELWRVLILVFAAGALLSGVYPALSLSSFQPITVLKGKFTSASKGAMLRKGLVVFQFAMSILLIAGTVAAYQQISYMRNTDLGVNISQTLVIHAPIIAGDHNTYKIKWEVFKNELQANKGIKTITASNTVPGKDFNWNQEGIHREGAKEESAVIYSMVEIDADYVPAYELELVAGKNFERPNGGEY